MSTIPEGLRGRLVAGCVTREDSLALLALLQVIDAAVRALELLGDQPVLAENYRCGAWLLVLSEYQQLIDSRRSSPYVEG